MNDECQDAMVERGWPYEGSQFVCWDDCDLKEQSVLIHIDLIGITNINVARKSTQPSIMVSQPDIDIEAQQCTQSWSFKTTHRGTSDFESMWLINRMGCNDQILVYDRVPTSDIFWCCMPLHHKQSNIGREPSVQKHVLSRLLHTSRPRACKF